MLTTNEERSIIEFQKCCNIVTSVLEKLKLRLEDVEKCFERVSSWGMNKKCRPIWRDIWYGCGASRHKWIQINIKRRTEKSNGRITRGTRKISYIMHCWGILWHVNTCFHYDIAGSSEPWLKSEKYAEQGTEVQLPCILKLPQCVGLHSIKWYRGNSRIFIYSEDVGVTRGNNDIAARYALNFHLTARCIFITRCKSWWNFQWLCRIRTILPSWDEIHILLPRFSKDSSFFHELTVYKKITQLKRREEFIYINFSQVLSSRIEIKSDISAASLKAIKKSRAVGFVLFCVECFIREATLINFGRCYETSIMLSEFEFE